MYQYIFFDLDDTLFDFKKSQRFAFKALTEKLGLTDSDELFQQFEQYNVALWKDLELGKITKDALLAQRFPNFFKDYTDTLPDENLDDYYRHQLTVSGDLIAGSLEILEKLKAAGKKIYAASNGVYHTQLARLEKTGLLPYFDELFISEKIGVPKPNAEFFLQSFAKINNFDLKSAIMIGDSLTSDIQGANNVQLTTCWMNPNQVTAPDNYKIDYEITTLSDLDAILF
ncbi:MULTISPECIES: YjjG family noncanonical pyrimidine nucleotidase [unclassified Facklamia]|uniref:YjjG family noncanonical pyrimidine nucleotidase n=1 Tax=Aerococcaceae TaxID=186827 RepID=UPI0013B859E3|nr:MULTISPECIES: YjjG family noncanonical pyrimidine nucleotidase [unclassified Facklamia]NEW63638.1 noncanonical pyrimidine nucleotidase, YjjG family [Facklamia sp. 252]NEW67109.1 noncanonical pyrimidine nucleotidase, YjjG family [Facklamia sp. 253]QQD66346.1 YjjG family noncanonical pyrimidine nucleotidase [Aerococcaceae bacterium zg-252]